MIKKFVKKLRAWLVKNHLTEDPNDFVAVVDSNGSVNDTDIVEALVDEGMELKRETAIDVISRYNRKCAEFAVSGYNVNTGLVHLRAGIKGPFFDKTWDKEKTNL